MKKFDDFFAAGVIIGSIGNIPVLIIVWVSQLIGIKIGSPWGVMTALIFKAPEVHNFWAILFGVISSFGVAIANGIIIGGLLRFTGRDFAYLKSIVVCISSLMFTLMVLFPLLGYTVVQHSIITVYHAFFNNIEFAFFITFLFLRYTTVGLKE